MQPYNLNFAHALHITANLPPFVTSIEMAICDHQSANCPHQLEQSERKKINASSPIVNNRLLVQPLISETLSYSNIYVVERYFNAAECT